jgi:hypothetical protein
MVGGHRNGLLVVVDARDRIGSGDCGSTLSSGSDPAVTRDATGSGPAERIAPCASTETGNRDTVRFVTPLSNLLPQ